MQLSVVIAHRSLIYIGDLERYRQSYLGKNYVNAQNAYISASHLMPLRGNPHNQLAVLHQLQSKNDLSAFYRYVLALFVSEPFKTAKDNLSLMFKQSIAVVDKNNLSPSELIKAIEGKVRWTELEVYIIYVLGMIYEPEYRKQDKYRRLVRQLRPSILKQIASILSQQNEQTKEEKEKEEEGQRESAKMMKQICVISIFLVHECYTKEEEYIGFKVAISWTLSLITTMMRSVVQHSSRLLSSVTLCCLWLRHNFDFAVPDIEKSPWMEMQIDQNDLDFSNRFFSEFAKILNLLQDRFESKEEVKGSDDCLLLPEQTEFYGIKPLHFVDFDDSKYAQNSDIPFIYHRRFCSNKKAALSMESNTAKATEDDATEGHKLYDRLRSKVLMEFATFSSQKMKGVLVFDSRGRCDSQRMKAVTVEESQHPVDPQCSLIGSQSANNAVGHSSCYSYSYSPPTRSPLDHPHLPHVPGSKHHEFLCSPTFPNSGLAVHRQHLSLSPLPMLHSQHQRAAPPTMLKLDARAESARQPHFSRPRNAYSYSAPSSPNGGATPNGHSQFMFNQRPPLIGYPENEAIDFGIPDHLNTRIHSLPTTPNGMSPGPYLHPHSSHPRNRNNHSQHRMRDNNGLTARQYLSFRDSHSDHLPVIPPHTAPAISDPNFHQNAYGFAASNGSYNGLGGGGGGGGAPVFQSQPPSPVHPIRASSPHYNGWGYAAANYGNSTQYEHDAGYDNVGSRQLMDDGAMFTPMTQHQNELDDMELAHNGNIYLGRIDGDCSPLMIEEAVTEALKSDGVVLFDDY